MNGKGDKYRPVDWKKWDENYTRIFNNSDKNKEDSILDNQSSGFIHEDEGNSSKE